MDKLWIRGASAIGGVLVIVYLCYQLFFAGSSSVKTESAIYYTANDSINATGYIIRDEQLLTSELDGVLSYSVDDGERVGHGGTVASVFSSPSAAATQSQIDSLQNQLTILKSITGINGTAVTDLDQINDIVQSALTDAVMSAAYDNLSGSQSAADALFAAINRRLIVTDGSIDLSSTIASVEAEI
ncbi:MAG: HlyD family efflux transporter periplasmic adaptor subunit, partial [Firmicutes bacterium]|nr:HlyD family efflux transporter periplasmic adaptor subunit [Bacillota bacterium]